MPSHQYSRRCICCPAHLKRVSGDGWLLKYPIHLTNILINRFCERVYRAKASGGEFSTWTESGYQFHFGNFPVGPMAALQYTLLDINGFNESGSLLPLRVRSDQKTSLRSDVGMRTSYTWQIGNILVIPTLLAAWEHEYFYSALPITVSTPLFPGDIKLFGPDERRNSATINAGAAIQWTPQISTYIGYQGQLGRSNYTSNATTGGFSFAF